MQGDYSTDQPFEPFAGRTAALRGRFFRFVVASFASEESMAHVLVVDDVADLCDMLSETLLEAGFDVATASSVDEAKAFLSRCAHGCLILLDLRFPDQPGQSLLD